MSGTKMLADITHRNGTPNRAQDDVVKRVPNSLVAPTEEPVVGELRDTYSRNISGRMPMKMPIAQEMSIATHPKQKPTGVVAKLMGIEAFPPQQQHISTIRSLKEDYPCITFNNHSGHEIAYKDVYEVWEQPSRINVCRSTNNTIDNRMALVRQKFMEAKRLSTDVKFLQSKEFEDALEVLSSNKDLFLKFVEEPNSSLPQTKQITVLKPSKMGDLKDEKQVRKQKKCAAAEDLGRKTDMLYRRCSLNLNNPKAENLAQPTRIVVLKPSPGKRHDARTPACYLTSSPILSERRDIYKDSETDKDSIEVAKEINHQMHESLGSRGTDESLLSPVFSNGYIGDDSSFNGSENVCVEDDNLSDLEIMTPASKHSSDFVNNSSRTPYSQSSFSRASYSPESSEIREAKKRLSDRWTLVTSNGINQEKKHVRRNSSTLGEMLANDLRNLSRSKSVPVSSSAYENIEVNFKVSNSPHRLAAVSKEKNKSKIVKSSSFKEKVTSLFFSRSKKEGNKKSFSSGSTRTCEKIEPSYKPAETNNDLQQKDDHNNLSHESRTKDSAANSTFHPALDAEGSKMIILSLRDALALERSSITEKFTETQDQPSPDSVLKPPFSDDARSSIRQSSETIRAAHPQALARSTPIESLARILPWDECKLESAYGATVKQHENLARAHHEGLEQEQERSMLIEKLFSLAGYGHENWSIVFSKCHSPESPLNPILLDKFLDSEVEETKCKERRSNQRLLFDCVNTALLEISKIAAFITCPSAQCNGGMRKIASLESPVIEEVCKMVRNWLSIDLASDDSDNCCLVVDTLVKKELGGTGWPGSICWELYGVLHEIGGWVLQDLVLQTVEDLTVECL